MGQRQYEPIKHTFTPDEIRVLGEALARQAQAVFDLKDEKSNSAAAFQAEIKAAEALVGELTTKINNGYEVRQTEALVLMETPRPGMKTIVRADNNQEIRQEPMTVAEMQGSFGFPEPGPE